MLEIRGLQEMAKHLLCVQDPAINHCAACEKILCKNCTKFHDNWVTHKNQNVLSVEELAKNSECQVKI